MLEQYYKIKGVIPRYVVSSNLETNFEVYNNVLGKCFMDGGEVFEYSAKTVDNSIEYFAFHNDLSIATASQQDLTEFISACHLEFFKNVLNLYHRCITGTFSMDTRSDFGDNTVKCPPAVLLNDAVWRVLTYSSLSVFGNKRIDLDEIEIDEDGIHGFVGTGADSMKVVIGWDSFLFSVARGEK